MKTSQKTKTLGTQEYLDKCREAIVLATSAEFTTDKQEATDCLNRAASILTQMDPTARADDAEWHLIAAKGYVRRSAVAASVVCPRLEYRAPEQAHA